jgi:hypothetical protein
MEHISDGTMELAVLGIHQRIAKEPAYQAVLYTILSYCKEPKAIVALEAEVLALPEMKVPLQTTQVLVSWLVACGGMKEIVRQEEPSLWATTKEGIRAFEEEASEDKLEALFVSESAYKAIYLRVLNFCKEAKSRMEIETHLENQPLLENPKIYANYFIETLERAGGLFWNGAWKTTQRAYVKL